jgi:hypothetical protein
MSKPFPRVATALALTLILPFAAGAIHAAEPAKPAVKGEMQAPVKPPPPAIPAPTIDTNNDGKPDAWDRDANGLPDAWDVNSDGKPDLFDDNGDGKPDDKKAPPPPSDDDGKPDQ